MKFKSLNPLLHSPLRLAIMSYMIANRKSDFKELKEATEATSGNLSVQLQKLSDAGYIDIIKGYKNNYQHTGVEIKPAGVDAFEEYVQALKGYIDQ
ncbi:MAG: transcriptional regulator [Saprospiraceae bacterium]|nr:transcriptional regulator [Saprospiraceae bacterium]